MRLSSLLILLILPACAGNPPEPVSDAAVSAQPDVPDGMRRVPAVLVHYGDGPVIKVPATARVGESFRITITTYGGGCVRDEITRVSVNHVEADVRPFQLEPVDPNTICTRELRIIPRLVDITFASSGRATVRIRGRSQPGDSAVVITRSVDVQ